MKEILTNPFLKYKVPLLASLGMLGLSCVCCVLGGLGLWPAVTYFIRDSTEFVMLLNGVIGGILLTTAFFFVVIPVLVAILVVSSLPHEFLSEGMKVWSRKGMTRRIGNWLTSVWLFIWGLPGKLKSKLKKK